MDSSASYSIFPFTILGVKAEDLGSIELTSVPFTSELKMYSPADGKATVLVFTDYSFTKLSIDEYDGRVLSQLR